MNNIFNIYAVIFKALGDETRLKILAMIAKAETCDCIEKYGVCNCKMCACNILEEFDFTQPTLSYHMKQLTDSGLIKAGKNGKKVFYSLNKEKAELLRGFIKNITAGEGANNECGKNV